MHKVGICTIPELCSAFPELQHNSGMGNHSGIVQGQSKNIQSAWAIPDLCRSSTCTK